MPASINLITELLLYFILGFMVATLELCFQQFMTPNMIFNKYALWLLSFNPNSLINKPNIIKRIIWYLSKPLGLCPYCNGTWIAITVYLYFFSIKLPILLFIGISWFFIHLIKTKIFK
jgi:hypothetical protein